MMGKAFQAEGTANARAGMNSAEQSINENASVVRAELTRGESVRNKI